MMMMMTMMGDDDHWSSSSPRQSSIIVWPLSPLSGVGTLGGPRLGACFLLGSAHLRLLAALTELTGYMNYCIDCSSFYQNQARHD